MPSPSHPQTPDAHLMYLPELLEAIFLKLDYTDLIRVQSVCTTWRDCITGTFSIQRKMWKRAIKIPFDADPNFDIEEAGSHELTLPNGDRFLERLVDLYKTFIRDADISSIERVLDSSSYENALEDANFQMRGLGPRVQTSSVLATLSCSPCCLYHTRFQYDNIHPMLRFLGDYDLTCFQGHGSFLHMTFKYGGRLLPGGSAVYSTFLKIRELCISLKDAHNAMNAGHLHNDLFTQPASTRLYLSRMRYDDTLEFEADGSIFWRIPPIYIVNEGGLTLEDVLLPICSRLPTIFRNYEGGIHYQLEHARELQWEDGEPQWKEQYPSKEDWEKQVARLAEEVEKVDAGFEELDVLMADMW